MISSRVFLAALCAAALAHAAAAWAQSFPTHPVRMIVPYPPGGGTDAIARPLAEGMRAALGQPVVIENRGGAGGNIGMEAAKRATPDGYTIVINADVVMAYEYLYAKLPYDPVRDFDPISTVATSTLVLAATPGLPQKTSGEVLAAARREKNDLTFANPGVGTPHHLAFTLLTHHAGLSITQIDYRGSGPALNDVLGGHVKLGVFTLGSITGQLDSGALRPLAIFGAQRTPRRPEIPTLTESGVSGVVSDISYSVWAPAGTPPDIIRRLNEAVRQAWADDRLRDQVTRAGFDVKTSSPEEARQHLLREHDRWGPVLRAAGVRPK